MTVVWGRAGQGAGVAGATLQAFHTHLAAADPGVQLPGLERFGCRLLPKLLPLFHCGQPETVLVGEVVAGAPGPAALDEGRGAEILQAGAGGDQRLAAALGARRSVLKQTGSGVGGGPLRSSGSSAQRQHLASTPRAHVRRPGAARPPL